MCMFSADIVSVSSTKIFARSSNAGKQFLVYSMEYQANNELAMILPLPVPPSPADDAVSFIDLSNYPDFFDDMAKGFPVTRSLSKGELSLDIGETLKVHDVGSFEASFVPTIADFIRLDKRFQLPDSIWSQLPHYKDYSFAVFRLKSGAKTIHPMAFEFPRRNSGELFFPTVHVHHGKVEERAEFDHALFCQSERQFSNWVSSMPVERFMKISETKGIIDSNMRIQMQPIIGLRKNEDIVLQES